MISDFVANELTKIRNAVSVGHKKVSILTNNVIIGVLDVLLDNGFISGFTLKKDEKRKIITAEVDLKYNPTPAIIEIKRVSKPGQRVYASICNMPVVHNGLGIAILSTSKGIMSNKQAKVQSIGGEVICTVF